MMQLLLKVYLNRVGETAKAPLERVNGVIRMHLAYVEEAHGSSIHGCKRFWAACTSGPRTRRRWRRAGHMYMRRTQAED